MKEADAILRFKEQFDSTRDAERQLRIAQPEWERLFKQTQELRSIYSGLAVQVDVLGANSGFVRVLEECRRAAREIASFRLTPAYLSFELQLKDIAKASAAFQAQSERWFGPLREAVQAAGFQFARQMELHSDALAAMKAHNENWAREFQTVAARLADIAKANFALPEAALLRWPNDIVAVRAPLLDDCIRNMAALETFHLAVVPEKVVSPEHLLVANQFVFDHTEIVRRLPPRLSEPEDQEREHDRQYRGPGIGARTRTCLTRDR